MSLSNYYKNSPSFQAEDLVKHPEKTTSGWNPYPRTVQPPFQRQEAPQSTTPPPDSQALSANKPPAERQVTRKEPVDSQESTLPKATEAENGHDQIAQEVDLSLYLLRDEAERMAAEAFQKGLAQGIEKAEEDFGKAAKALHFACEQMDTLRATIISNSSVEVLDFALAIAEKILRFSVREQDHTIVATVEEALRRAVKSDEFTIHIHPADYDILAAKSSELVSGLSGLNNLIIRKDPTIERGGARIDSDNCTIDATIAGQFAMIREEVKDKG